METAIETERPIEGQPSPTLAQQISAMLDAAQRTNILAVTKVTDCDTTEKLAERVLQFVRFGIFGSGKPATLGTINRRFGKKATELGTNSRDIVEFLIGAGKVRSFPYKRATIVMDELFCFDQDMGYGLDFDGLEIARNRMFERAE